MQKVCTNDWCQASYEVSDADLAFYEKVSPVIEEKQFLIPAPTLCPDCRLQRRIAWRNDRKFYRRSCDATGQSTLSIYSPDKPFKIYASSAWWKDTWDPLSFGQTMDFTKTFFAQFSVLMRLVPRPALNCEQSENCDYCHNTVFSRNCYMCSAIGYSEDCYHASSMTNCKDVVDATGIHGSELCTDSINCRNCYRGVSLFNCFECTDCALCTDCHGCNQCIGCTGLVRKDLHIFNQPVSRQEFEEARLGMRSSSRCDELRTKAEALARSLPHRNVLQIASEHCIGDNIFNSKNARFCFDVQNCEDAAYSHHVKNFKDSMDVFGAFMGGELQYENNSCGGSVRTMHSFLSYHNSDCAYLNYCHYCQDCFGCIGLRHKQYCILNRQYTKQEYDALLPRIIEHMQETREWGEYFPVQISPYAYNESPAQDYFPLTKEECDHRKWQWKSAQEEMSNPVKMIPGEQLPDSIDDVPEDILHWAIVCQRSKRPFKIISQELNFYRKLGVPVPRFHPDVRHEQRAHKRGYGKLWPRACAQCTKQIRTTYAPDRPERVYCEECYLKEVY